MKSKKVLSGLLLTVLSINVMVSGCENIRPAFAGGGTARAGKTEASKAKLPLTFWSWAYDSDAIKPAYEAAIKKFNAENGFNAEIKAVYTPGEQYKTKLQTEMATNNAPDIFGMWPAGKMKPYVEANRLYAISDLLDKDMEWKDRYVDGIFDLTSFNGKVYGIPCFRTVVPVYYNKDMFARYGLQVPATWNELLAVVETLKDNGKEAFATDLKDPWIVAMYAEIVADRLDPEAYKSVQKDPNWLLPTYLEVGRKMQELAKAGAFPKGATGIDYMAARSLFDQEKAGMFLMGSWDVGYLGGESPIKDKIGAFKFPAIEGGKGDINNWLAGVEAVQAISANTKNPEAAGAFLKVLTEPEIAKELIAEKGGYLAAVKVQPDSTKAPKLFLEVMDLMKDRKQNFTFYDNNLGPVVGEGFNNAIQSIVVGKLPEEAFRKLDEIAKKEAGMN